MKFPTTYWLIALAKLMAALGFADSAIKEICLLLRELSKNQGDGGVDVTGAPNSRPVEGAGFGQLTSFSRKIWASLTRSSSKYQLLAVIIGGSNFGAAGIFSIYRKHPASF